MSLPPGFLDELRTRLSLGQVVGRKVMWDSRKSNQAKGDLWAPCPFHQEKSASFHVDDRKGFYYCFGCHAKGDAISFVRETENVDFMEAVRILAGEAGMPMPQRDPQAQQKADTRTQLAEVMEQAVQYYRLQLKTGVAADARAYLERRGLSQQALDRWEIGFAPDAWQGLWDHLKSKNISDELIIGAGLAKPSQKGGKPYDTFRGRIMFPIRDARGRCTAFGGRAMDPNDNAKYLNSPETELFDKGRSLYNHGSARAAAGKGQPLIVAEGYMDVIALSEAGFEAAVAPLGTAITESQLQMLWRIAPEPIIALDGDTAGLRAAMRLIDLALPLLEAGQSLRFAMMPEGQDPDDLLKSAGAPALQKLLDGAMPMVRLLWQRETEGRVFDSPERKAALDKALREKIKTIADPSIRNHYGQEIKELRFQLFRPQRAPSGQRRSGGQRTGGGFGKWQPEPVPLQSTKSSVLATGTGDSVTHILRESVILAALICCPEVVESFETPLERLRCINPDNAALRDLILRHAHEGAEVLREKISSARGPEALENLLNASHVAIVPCIRTPGNADMARITVAEELAKLSAARGLDAEIADAAEDLTGVADEGVTWRLSRAAEAADSANRSTQKEGSGDFVTADNGVKMEKDEVTRSRAMFDAIDFSKRGRKQH
ncbi:DNA primase [Pseudosulfitobacter pseudonitzschiae]|uniref:DNA primase n=1 Tax=Pseudosulfitobacter pseudonitzschiae TaxID=1402135 RepID=UPI001AF12EEE|nr:DNA primase [Pseudosulfitobacter pseudonitzschiae]MBM1814258.1 DNA primase [Pseudosulfitobacter pseudonitzschiae]MBM1831251.1 DNA primase [Pseudosulfitobacter pseudonitzschiae]MBM1836118.1 DNA primase [Pseudosulfitobacter pseudonitzschiae]MBM1840964.1 DNA primase [Pseudosulfitobacter pseudonitzschiae]MBM1845048.1 DNA primase [Pseudosulfitobacter pseudonitzschiae]